MAIRVLLWPFYSEVESSLLDIPSNIENSSAGISKGNKLKRVIRFLKPGRHSEQGNVLTEHYYFSRLYWKRLFNKTGWKLVSLKQLPVFHSGNYLFFKSISVLEDTTLLKS